MKFSNRSLAVVLAASSFLLPQNVLAQPDTSAPKAQNPPSASAKAARDKAITEMAEKLKTMTLQQTLDYVRGMQEQALRADLTNNGFNDLELQEIVINFVQEQNAGSTAARAVAARLRDALDKNVPAAQIATLTIELQTAAEAEGVRREKATGQLYETLKVDERPRLEALLRLNGIIGEEIRHIGDATTGMSTLGTLPMPDADQPMKAEDLDKSIAIGREASEKIATMTPAQMRDYIRELQEQTVRTALTQSHFDEAELQNTIIDFLRAQNAARTDIRLQAARLRGAAIDKNTSELKLLQLMAQWQILAEEESARREEATDQLRQTLKSDENPRINAMLHLYGFIGDAMWHLSDPLTNRNATALLPTGAEVKQIDAAPRK